MVKAARSKNSNLIVVTAQVCSRCLEGNRAPPLKEGRREEARKDLRSQILDWSLSFLFPELTSGMSFSGKEAGRRSHCRGEAQDVQECRGSRVREEHGRLQLLSCHTEEKVQAEEETKIMGDPSAKLEGLDFSTRFQTVVGKVLEVLTSVPQTDTAFY